MRLSDMSLKFSLVGSLKINMWCIIFLLLILEKVKREREKLEEKKREREESIGLGCLAVDR